MMATSDLPYDMGNAPDLLRHGVLAEFVRWRLSLGKSVRFLDLFGGKPVESVAPETTKRVQALEGSALLEAQSGIGDRRYYGSGKLVRGMAESVRGGSVRVLTSDSDPGRRDRLRASGLSMLHEECPIREASPDKYDGYIFFEKIVHEAEDADLVLIDDFARFLPCKAQTVVPQMAEMAKRAAVLLFALNLDPSNKVGRRFDALLEKHLGGAWRMTCPPPPETEIRGECKYHAEVVLAACPLLEPGNRQDVAALRARLHDFAKNLAGALALSGRDARMLMPRVTGEDGR